MTRANSALARALRQTCPRGSRATNDQLLPAVAAGDPKAAKAMIETNTSLVVRKVRAYLRSRPEQAYMSDDMIGAGFIALVEAVQNLAKGGPTESPNVTGFISVYVNGAIKRVGQDAQTCSARTYFRRAAAGQSLPQAIAASDEYEPYYDTRPLAELREEIEAACETDLDREILRQREAGLADHEIAAALKVSKTTIFNARKQIETRFNERCATLKS